MKSSLKTLSILAFLLLVPYFAICETSDYMYFKLFFQKAQPKEYFEFSPQEDANMKTNINEPHYSYMQIDDFKTPDSWSIADSSLKDLANFSNTYTSTTPEPASSYLHWKTLDSTQEEYLNAKTPSIKSSSADPQITPIKNLFGVRALYLNKNYHKLVIYPKTPLPLKTRGEIYNIELWVLGIGKNYTMYIEVMDYLGIRHKLYLGNLYYNGWKRLSVHLAEYGIPLSRYVFHKESYLRLTKIIFESATNKMEGFFGTWISDLGFDYRSPDSIDAATQKDNGTALYDQFDWTSSTSNGITPTEENGVTTNNTGQNSQNQAQTGNQTP